MLLEAIFVIIAISFVFCCCTFCCYLVFQTLVTEEPEVEPETEAWEAKHYYDPLPLSTPSPPDNIFKPTPYTFKLQNGNGVYSASLPHAVINPAVLQYPPGHVLDQQRVPPPAQHKPVPQKEKSRRHSQVRSRTPSPRRAKNVWSTDVDFHRPPNNYSNHQSSHHPHLQQLKDFQLQQRELQQHYRQHHQPVVHHEEQKQQQHRRQQHPPVYREGPQQQKQMQHIDHHHQPPEYYYDQSQSLQHQPIPFMATTHAINAYPHHHHQQRYKSRLKEAIT